MTNLFKYVEEEIKILDTLPNLLYADEEDFADIELSFGQRTIFDNVNFTSNVKSLATAQTVIVSSDKKLTENYTQKKKDIFDNAKSTLEKVFEYLRKCPLLKCQGREGDNREFSLACDLYLSYYKKEASHLACMFNAMAYPLNGAEKDNLKVICIPEWNEKDRQVLVLPERGLTFILGSDYYEEIRNAFLRLGIFKAKERGLLPLHAAAKMITTRKDDVSHKTGVIIFGISSTGKTTHALHDHGFTSKGEKVEIIEDDLIFLTSQGELYGSERGFYIRCDSLSGANQPLLYHSAKMSGVIMENVLVDYKGNVYFENKTITGNSHAVIPKDILKNYSISSEDLPKIDELSRLIFIFMAKNYTCIPIVSKLTKEEAAACYILCEPFDAMASEFGRCDGKNSLASMPYGVGNNVEDVNKFYELLKSFDKKIDCYMINNGGVGELVDTSIDGTRKMLKKVTRVSIPEISRVIRALVKQNITWKDDKNWLIKVPEYIEGMNINKYDLYNYYDQGKIDLLISQIRGERRAFADNYEGLDPKISQAIEF
ncbi:MAG: phosphoenolpyruvate carboxykinase (ATP) [Abditibacteriota bacterium]|nr:phosphoenolpyruvate carboxykinase (ATP) [Abditibacteriota bacterium]